MYLRRRAAPRAPCGGARGAARAPSRGERHHDPGHRGQDPLRGTHRQMKREIDALQVQVMKERGPWYRQVPVVVPLLVSVLALVLALITTFLGQRDAARKEKHDAGGRWSSG